MRELNEKEEKIIELLQQSPKSFKELNSSGGNLLRSDSTLDRLLKSLKRIEYIESFPISDPNTRIKKRYRLTKKYYDEKEAQGKDQQISRMIKSRLNWQNVFDRMLRFLEFEYPMIFQNPELFEAKEIYSDLFSYLVFFNIDSETLKFKPKLYFELMLYLILHHPDEKYESIQKQFEFNPIEFQEVIENFKNKKKLEEFVYQEQKSSHKEIYYLISDDPILYFIRQQVETYFFKFLLCWQFPGVYLEDHFDFIFNYSHKILEELDSKYKNQNEKNLVRFLKKNRLCLLTYIREYILEFLDKINMETTLEGIDYPLELLTINQKEVYLTELILSSEILTGVETGYLEYHIESLALNPKKIEEIITKILVRIEEISQIELKDEETLLLKSRLLMLIRIFYHYNKTSYRIFKKEYYSKSGRKIISYSSISADIFNKIKEILVNLDIRIENVKKNFIIRHFLERIDHLTNKIIKYPDKKAEFFISIQNIYDIASESFSEKSQYPFFKKKCELFFKDIEMIKESEVISILRKLVDYYPRNSDILNLVFRYLNKTRNLARISEIIRGNKWSLKDKILIFERNVLDIPSDFNIIEFFDLTTEDFQYLLKSSTEDDSKLLLYLLKSLAFILEQRGSLFDCFFIYYFTCILEQDIAFDPLKRGFTSSYFPPLHFSLNYFKAYGPGYLNLLRLKRQYSENLFSSLEFRERITKLLSQNIRKIETKNEFENYIASFPILFENFSLLSRFFQLDDEFNEIMLAIEKGIEPDNTKTKEKVIKTSQDISKEEKDILNKISDNFKNYNKKTNSLDFLLSPINIDSFLQNINKKALEKILPGTIYPQDRLTEIANKQMEYSIDKFPNLAGSSIFNLLSYSNPFYNKNIKVENFNLQFFNYNYFQKSLEERVQETDLGLIDNRFGVKNRSKDYPFNLAFDKKYEIPKREDYNFWFDLIKDFENKKDALIELLDLYLFHSRFFTSFEIFEKLVLLILNHYDLNRALQYIDTFYNYLIWYYKRLKNPRTYIIPYTLGLENLFHIFDFGFNTIKAKTYWDFRDRYKSTDYVKKAYKSLNYLEAESENLFGLASLNNLKRDLNALREKMI